MPEDSPVALGKTEPRAKAPWSIKRPYVTNVLTGIGAIFLLASFVTSIDAQNPWALLLGAFFCVLLAFPNFVGELIHTVKAPGGWEIGLRTSPPAQSIDQLAAEAPTTLEHRRLLLAQLRTAGVEIRNRGLQLSHTDLDKWLGEVAKWRDTVTRTIEAIDPADAEWFRTLDAVPPARIPLSTWVPDHAKAYGELDFMLRKIEQLIVRYGHAGDLDSKS